MKNSLYSSLCAPVLVGLVPAVAIAQDPELRTFLAPDWHYGQAYQWGGNLAVDGRWLLVSNEVHQAPTVFERTQQGWVMDSVIRSVHSPLDTGGPDYDIDGDRIAVGFHNWGGAAGTPEGRVELWKYEGGDWVLEGALPPPSGTLGTRFGSTVRLEGSSLFIGEWSYDSPVANAGRIHVYSLSGADWVPSQILTVGDFGSFSGAIGFGSYLALEGQVMAAAAGVSTVGGNAVYIYEDQGGSGWQQSAKIQRPSAPHESRYFGEGLAISKCGDVLAIGDPRPWSFGMGHVSGEVFIFERQAGQWVFVQRIEASDGAPTLDYGDRFGGNLAFRDKDTLLVSAIYAPGNGSDGGAVYVFHRAGDGTWPSTESWKLVTSQPSTGLAAFGAGLAVDDGLVYVGAPFHGANGEAYVFGLYHGLSYCPGVPHSGGTPARLQVTTVDGESLACISSAPPYSTGLLLASPDRTPPAPFLDGSLCLSSVSVLGGLIDLGGGGTALIDMGSFGPLQDGFHLQFVYRDSPGSGLGGNLSNAVLVPPQQ